MPNNRILLLVNSVYQLLTAVHMKCTLLQEAAIDLLVSDITPALKGYIPRLRGTGLFERVLFANVNDLNRSYPLTKLDALNEAFADSRRIFQWVLSDDLDVYDAVYFANFDLFTRMLANWYYAQLCEFVWFEDGFSSYVIDYLKEDRAAVNRHREGRRIQDKVRRVLLYEPRLAMRGDGLLNCPLPKISRKDTAFRSLLNGIFDYHKPEDPADFIFLEQSFRAEGIQSNDLALMKECQETVGPGRFVVKPHPRNPENLPLQMGLTRRYDGDAPWELFLLNEGAADKTVLTVCSNGALTASLVFGMDMNTVMLYRLFDGKVLWKEDEILKRYLQTFQRQCAGKNYDVPQTVYELQHILRYLGGQHGEQSH